MLIRELRIQIVEQFEALGSTIGLHYSMVSVIDANMEANVYMNSILLVYISTYNVVFGGKPIVNAIFQPRRRHHPRPHP